MNITKRDVKFFFLGIVFLFILESILGWNNVMSDMKQGYIDGYNAIKK